VVPGASAPVNDSRRDPVDDDSQGVPMTTMHELARYRSRLRRRPGSRAPALRTSSPLTNGYSRRGPSRTHRRPSPRAARSAAPDGTVYFAGLLTPQQVRPRPPSPAPVWTPRHRHARLRPLLASAGLLGV